MPFTDSFILLSGMLVAVSILATVPADRSGVPLLVVFLGVGMVAGADGLGGVSFESVADAHLVGTAALAVILFDGGLHTPFASFRTGLWPGLAMATAGVLVTAAVTAVAGVVLFGLDWGPAALLAAMVSSTDAAAVFYLLRARGIEVHARVRNTLEIESGVNDPLAIFLTLALTLWLAPGPGGTAVDLALMLVRQIAFGAAAGLGGGWLLTALINRLRLAPSLYPLLALAGGLTVYGAAAVAGGSGFLAAYLAGLIVGNRASTARGGIRRFHDGMAWLCQIGLFLLLGLLVEPTRLLPVAAEALGLAAVLIVLARPLATLVCLLPLRFEPRQIAFMSWTGLRGAVPIVLSLFPLIAGVDQAEALFNRVFFIVLVSLLVQGWTVSPLARRLGLIIPRRHPAMDRVDLTRPKGHELVTCVLPAGAPAVQGCVADLDLPAGVRVLAVIRRGEPVAAEPELPLQAGDQLYLLLPGHSPALEERFQHWVDTVATARDDAEQAYFGEFTVAADAPMSAFAAMYLGGDAAGAGPAESVGAFVRRRLRHQASEGDSVRVGGVMLTVREMEGERITQIGVRLPRRGRG
ncbi:potassium/proton antiporter [Arhodomonas aquaeolei]|uniref:potassium/proton antiporter n=1 Tax=Arhodomonas aquaeolei TaxID=2369 RepID=UPI00036EA284|nr:potassium/proton antiporter [Arhodomonas aquaeolei]